MATVTTHTRCSAETQMSTLCYTLYVIYLSLTVTWHGTMKSILQMIKMSLKDAK